MKYKNLKTGFVFETACEIHGEGWVKLDPQPITKGVEEKPKTTTKKTVSKRAKK